jgi:hypothetical protein
MEDKLLDEYKGSIDQIVNFAKTVNITYDYLRAIAFEINQGYTFEESLGDLNITRTSDVRFDMLITMNDGRVYTSYSQRIDLYAKSQEWFNAFGEKGARIRFGFTPTDIKFVGNQLCLDGSKAELYIDEDDYWDMSDDEKKVALEAAKARKIREIIFSKCNYSNLDRYYAV